MPEKYFLMNKDRIVADVVLGIDGEYLISNVKDMMPYGIDGTSLNGWIDNRKASKHNHHLALLMEQCGCGTTDGYLKFTHSATLNDTFWVKKEGEDINWDDVSLYRNEFNEVVSRLAFEGGGLYGFEFSSTSPELTTDGSFRKCWKREEDGIYLYKRGRDDAGNAGLEPFCEVMASEIAPLICKDSVKYTLTSLHREIASKCKLFTSEEYGYVPYKILESKRQQTLKEIEETLGKAGVDVDEFRRMVVFDSVVLNTDRHLGNFGVLIDNDTMEITKLAPVFDFNLSLMPYLSIDEVKHFGKRSLEFSPSIGSDFVESAKEMLTPDIRADLINMSGFHFSMREYEKFPRERITAIENVVNTNINAILGKSKMRLVDVYPHIPSEKELSEKAMDEAYEIGNAVAYDRGLIYDFDARLTDEGGIELALWMSEDKSSYCVFYDDYRRHKFICEGKELSFTGPNCKAMQMERQYTDVIRAVRAEVSKIHGREEKEIKADIEK